MIISHKKFAQRHEFMSNLLKKGGAACQFYHDTYRHNNFICLPNQLGSDIDWLHVDIHVFYLVCLVSNSGIAHIFPNNLDIDCSSISYRKTYTSCI